MRYLKIINNFLKTKVCILLKLFKELKNGIEILVGQAILKLWIKTAKMFFFFFFFFFLFDVFIYLYLGLVGGDKTYKIEPPDPITLSK